MDPNSHPALGKQFGSSATQGQVMLKLDYFYFFKKKSPTSPTAAHEITGSTKGTLYELAENFTVPMLKS